MKSGLMLAAAGPAQQVFLGLVAALARVTGPGWINKAGVRCQDPQDPQLGLGDQVGGLVDARLLTAYWVISDKAWPLCRLSLPIYEKGGGG